MKDKDKDITLQLVDVFNEYLDLNGLTVSYAARCCKIPRTSLAEWAKGQRYSLWQSERTAEERVNMARLLPDSISKEVLEAVENAEKQAFSIGFRTALELVKELEAIKR